MDIKLEEILESAYRAETLENLERLLTGLLQMQDESGKNDVPGINEVREMFFGEFLKYADYSCASEWNRAVRLCECLAIIGWGQHEALQAIRGKFISGAPTTGFINEFREGRFVESFWSDGNMGMIMDEWSCWFHASPDDPLHRKDTEHYKTDRKREALKLDDQRNWIVKNPIDINLCMLNHFPGSGPLVHSIVKELPHMIDTNMRPALYGNLFNYFGIIVNLSSDWGSNIIVSDKVAVKKWNSYHEFSIKLLRFHSFSQHHQIEAGPFRKSTGNIYTNVYLNMEFSDKGPQEQKRELADHFIAILEKVSDRLKKKYTYNYDLMISDFRKAMGAWCALPIPKRPYYGEFSERDNDLKQKWPTMIDLFQMILNPEQYEQKIEASTTRPYSILLIR